ncbi:NUDIX hydrolase [Bradyrhizobium daqingense]|uniref:NUDIX hydrolase n=1 Tax=Bradyrhizobium daqingense TaxID=993502 RepID=UPI0013157AB7|nr:NUDIX hydrolase [Bradyrhizobium daqingense]UFS89540.1 NUDIX hydrolase [Bradyrhizobium daqingense]
MKLCDHTSVGILVRKGSSILLIERAQPPFGFAPPAGHVDDHGSYEQAAIAELAEEVGLTALHLSFLHEERLHNRCRRPNGTWHLWKIYEAIVEGEVRLSRREARRALWASPVQLRELAARSERYQRGLIGEREWNAKPGLEPIWVYLFGQLERQQSNDRR